MVFGQRFRQRRMPLDRASQEKQNGTNFGSVAPSSEELSVRKELPLYSGVFDKKVTGYH